MNLSHKMSTLLPKEMLCLLRRIGRLGNEKKVRVYIVGGVVRDLLLGAKNLDLDIVVESDAIKFGRLLAEKLKASLVVHKRFGTCSAITASQVKIDLATARKEVYTEPAALPTVEFSSIKDDLMRRDFTINAMAVSLNRSTFGQLIDFFGGAEDLRRGRIKVLHAGSFIDDPTRIFRAVRFEQRFGFAIDAHTEELIRGAIKASMFEKAAPQRIRSEIVAILSEQRPLKAIKRMADLDELRFLHPRIKLDEEMVDLFDNIARYCKWYEESSFRKRVLDKWLVYFMALISALSYREAIKICDRFVFRKADRLRIVSFKENFAKATKVLDERSNIPASRIYSALEPLSFEVVLVLASFAQSERAQARIGNFFRKYNGMKTSVKGDDLKALGLKACPDYRKILDKVLFAKIDGKLNSKKAEMAFAQNLVKKICI